MSEERLAKLKQEQKAWMISFMKRLIDHYGGSYSISAENAFQIFDAVGALVLSIGFRPGSGDILYVLGDGSSGKVSKLSDLKGLFPGVFGG